ncbi:SpdD protein, partial [Streptomyces scabiei]|uniref:SpdD protein n=1 Tax=Streptomyces scabiei TaxID=1930 RepID=UPI000A3D3137
MFTPKYPPQDTAPLPTTTTPTPTAMSPTTHVPAPAPVPSASVFSRTTVQLTPGSTLALATAGGALVLVV